MKHFSQGCLKNREKRHKLLQELRQKFRNSSPDELVNKNSKKAFVKSSDPKSYSPKETPEISIASLTSDIYNQYQTFVGFQSLKVMEIEKAHSISLNATYPGTERYDNAPVYGYTDNGVLLPNGGKENSYNPGFNQFHMRYNAFPNPEIGTYNLVTDMYNKSVSYFHERGFPLPITDVANGFEDVFIYTLGSPMGADKEIVGPPGVITGSGAMSISIKMNFGNNDYPSSVDLMTTASPLFEVLALFEPNEDNKKNSHWYALRIPVTTDFQEYESNKNTQAISYYDVINNIISIHVPETEERKLGFEHNYFPNPDMDYEIDDYLLYFDGSFQLMKRDETNQIVPADKNTVMYLVQTSSTITTKSRYYYGEGGEMQLPTDKNATQKSTLGNQFVGAVFTKAGKGNAAFDYYLLLSDTDASAQNVDPFVIGNNPITKFKESFFGGSIVNQADTNFGIRTIIKRVYDGEVYPEQISDPLIIPPPTQSPETALRIIAIHETVHSTQFSNGWLYFEPLESIAVAINYDYRASLEYTIFGVGTSLDSFNGLVRGYYTPLGPEYTYSGIRLSAPYSTGFFWIYLSRQFDLNYQLPRRLLEILDETYTPLYKLRDFQVPNVALAKSATANNLAMNQGLKELYNKNYADVITDFAISMTYLRNNLSIPSQYRHTYPWFLQNKDYDGGSLGTVWSDYQVDDGRVTYFYDEGLKAIQYITPYLAQNVNIEAEDMRFFVYNIPNDTTSVRIKVEKGTWRFSVFQFTSDGTPEGIFIQDPALGKTVELNEKKSCKTFRIKSHCPKYTPTGIIKLVCVNVTLTDQEGLNNLFEDGVKSGKISILRNGGTTIPDEVSEGLKVKVGPTGGPYVYEFNARYFDGQGDNGGTVDGYINGPGENAIPLNACNPLVNDLTNKIGLGKREICYFYVKVENILDAGAKGAIIFNRIDEPLSSFDPTLIEFIVPEGKAAVFIGLNDGTTLSEYLTQNPDANVVISDPPFAETVSETDYVPVEICYYLSKAEKYIKKCKENKACKKLKEALKLIKERYCCHDDEYTNIKEAITEIKDKKLVLKLIKNTKHLIGC